MNNYHFSGSGEGNAQLPQGYLSDNLEYFGSGSLENRPYQQPAQFEWSNQNFGQGQSHPHFGFGIDNVNPRSLHGHFHDLPPWTDYISSDGESYNSPASSSILAPGDDQLDRNSSYRYYNDIMDLGGDSGLPAHGIAEGAVREEDDLTEKAYNELLFQCLKRAPGYSLRLKEIYEWFIENVEKARENPKGSGWKCSVRHNLSMNSGFEKVPYQKETAKTEDRHIWRLADHVIANNEIKPTTRDRRVNPNNAASSSNVNRTARPSNANRAARSSNTNRATSSSHANSVTSSSYANVVPDFNGDYEEGNASASTGSKKASGSIGGKASKKNGARKNPPRNVQKQQYAPSASLSPTLTLSSATPSSSCQSPGDAVMQSSTFGCASGVAPSPISGYESLPCSDEAGYISNFAMGYTTTTPVQFSNSPSLLHQGLGTGLPLASSTLSSFPRNLCLSNYPPDQRQSGDFPNTSSYNSVEPNLFGQFDSQQPESAFFLSNDNTFLEDY